MPQLVWLGKITSTGTRDLEGLGPATTKTAPSSTMPSL